MARGSAEALNDARTANPKAPLKRSWDTTSPLR